MEREQEKFDAMGFLELLGDSLRDQLPDHKARTGVLSARIHLRDIERPDASWSFPLTRSWVAPQRGCGPPSTRPAWSIHPRARPAPRASVLAGT
jgi:hypothetical protein